MYFSRKRLSPVVRYFSLNVPFGDLKAHYLAYKSDIDTAVLRVLNSGYFILGPELKRFEEEFASYLGVKYAVGCASGTEAIYLALAAAGVNPGDQVITVAHTAVPTISAISMCFAEPVFVDIDPHTYVMDVSKVEAKISSRTKAIVPVHLYGQMVDMDPLMELSKKYDIPVIEDVAQATGATYKMRKAGSIGRMSAFSFYPSKNLGAFGDGGAVATDNEEDYQKLLKLRNYGQSVRYHHDEVGINSRLDEIQAAILAAQLPYLPQWNHRRREIAHRYTAGLTDLLLTPSEVQNAPHVYHLYVIRTADRDEMQKQLQERGVQTLIHYPIPAHLQKAYRHLGYKEGDLPQTELAAKKILSLPMHPQLKTEEVDLVIQEVRHCVQRQAARKSSGIFVPVLTPPSVVTP
jgi:dTDP-4-amino-4,6-dideoxygalactose transaminase